MSEAQPTEFVVKATSDTGLEMWISVSRTGGYRAFGPREKAAIFKTRLEAQSAIRNVPPAFQRAGFTFTVEGDDLPLPP
jgi:hypothetical protein